MVIWVVLEVNTADGYEGQGGDSNITFFLFSSFILQKAHQKSLRVWRQATVIKEK
jgi:hypothetical protein